MKFINSFLSIRGNFCLLFILFFFSCYILSALGVISSSSNEKKRWLLYLFSAYLGFLLIYFGYLSR